MRLGAKLLNKRARGRVCGRGSVGSLAELEPSPWWGEDSGTDAPGDDMSEGWGSSSSRGSVSAGGGGGGLSRELGRAFGHYNRHLARLQYNLRETNKFFRDIKYSQGPAVFPAASAGPIRVEEQPARQPAFSALDGAPGGGGTSLQAGKDIPLGVRQRVVVGVSPSPNPERVAWQGAR